MNQDFGLIATPANARRLLALQRFNRIELSEDIRNLADQDAIDESHFDPFVCPYSIVKQTITQFLLDCKLRGIIQVNYHPEFNALALLHAIKLAHPKYITIVSSRRQYWNPVITALSLGGITQIISTLSMSYKEVDQYRCDTVLIIDIDMRIFRNKVQSYSREYPQTIIYEHSTNISQLTHWSIWAHLLFPAMPHPLYVRIVNDVPSAWNKIQLSMFAPFYNTCIFPNLITDPEIIRQLDDCNSIDNMSYRRGMLIA